MMARLSDPLAVERPMPSISGGIVQVPRTLDSGAVGQGLQLAGASVEKGADEIYRAQKIEEDKINTLGAENAINSLRGQVLDLSIGKENGFTNLKGKDAVEQPVYQEWSKKLDDARQKIADDLPNDAQRSLFGRRADITALQYKESILRHLARERDTFSIQSFTGTVKAETEMAAAQWDSPNDIGVSLERVKNASAELDDHLGSHQDVRDSRRRDAVTAIHQGVIQGALAANDFDYASRYLETNKDQIDPLAQLKMKREIKSTAMPVQAKNDAMAIIQADLPTDGSDPTATQIRSNIGKWMKKSNEVADQKYPNDPIYRDLVSTQIQTYTNRIATAQQAVERNARNDILSAVITPGPNGAVISDLNHLLATPEMRDKWNMLESDQQVGVMHIIKENARLQDPPETVEAMNKFHSLKGLFYNDPEAFHDTFEKNFSSLGTQIPHHLMLQLSNLDTSLDKNSAKALSVQQSVQMIKALDKMYEQGTGFALPKGKDEKNKNVQEAYNNWTNRMLDGIQSFTEEHKHRPNAIELRDIGKKLLVQGYETGTGHSWFGLPTFGQKKTFLFQQDDPGKFSIKAPESEVPDITSALSRKFGRTPTRDEIDQFYAASVLQNR